MSTRVAAAQQAAFDVHDAAAYVGLSVDVVRRAMNAGSIVSGIHRPDRKAIGR